MSKHLVIAAAGTGGHVMPGVAVAKILISRGWTVSWIGTEQGMERRIVERQKIPFTALDFQGLRGKGLKTMLFGGFKLLKCIAQSRTILTKKHAGWPCFQPADISPCRFAWRLVLKVFRMF